jgi:hypothetical protein
MPAELTNVLSVRLSDEDLKTLVRAAADDGRSLSDFMRRAGLFLARNQAEIYSYWGRDIIKPRLAALDAAKPKTKEGK